MEGGPSNRQQVTEKERVLADRDADVTSLPCGNNPVKTLDRTGARRCSTGADRTQEEPRLMAVRSTGTDSFTDYCYHSN